MERQQSKRKGKGTAYGRALAVQAMRKLAALGSREYLIDGAKERGGKPQTDVLRHYITRAQVNDRAAAGFYAILTDALGSYVGEGGQDVAGCYARYVKRVRQMK